LVFLTYILMTLARPKCPTVALLRTPVFCDVTSCRLAQSSRRFEGW